MHGGFQHIRFHRAVVPFEIDIPTGMLRFDAGEMPASEWAAYSARIQRNLERAQLVNVPKPKPRPSLSAQFIAENYSAINAAKRGRMKRAPWWLRLFYDFVVGKEPFHDN